ncbi:unnamed protein product [Diabrotica balteata]|uniref:Mitochondrial import inner membrane translocase subunit n=1 Tax=Diabrotica balteata TaxID=107213 RepID=A0A9N9SNA0_DIABA|nr:unnamed protein product [Diabrotica balteata]
MDSNFALHNFKDFLLLYNTMSELCFKRCIDNVNSIKPDEGEIACVEDCATKFIKMNNKIMQSFIVAQTEITNKQRAEAEKKQLQEQQAENSQVT